MDKSKRTAAKDEPLPAAIVANPPRPNKLLLGLSALFWLAFLLVLVALAMTN